MLFHYQALDRDGREVRGGCYAEGEAQAQAQLRERGLTLLSLERRGGAVVRARFSAADERDLFEELVTLLEAGLDLLAALRTIEEATRREGKRRFVATLREGLLAGQPLSQGLEGAYRGAERELPQLYRQLLQVGERSGALGEALRRMVEHLEFRARVREELRAALLYPAALLVVSLLALGFILMVVVPRFAAMFPGDAVERLPQLSAGLIMLGRWLEQWSVGGVAVAVVLLVGLGWLLLRSGSRLAQLVGRLPLVGRLVQRVDGGNYFSALGLMLEGGVDLAAALPMAARVPAGAAAQRSAEVVQELVREGGTLAAALANTELATPSELSLLVAAERSGRLGEMLVRLGRNRVERFERSTRAALKLLEPLVVVVMGALVGVIVVALMLAVVSLNDLPL